MREPTSEECSANAKLQGSVLGDDRILTACWYPQMGGYVAKCLIDPHDNGCFDAYVWHDGEWPFTGEGDLGRNPIVLHHCAAEQFVTFGRFAGSLAGYHIYDPDDPEPSDEGVK